MRAFADAAALECGFDEDDRYRVKTALNEAAANAIEHGSRSAGEAVYVTARVEGGALVFYVRDTGRFRPPVERGEEIAERGRGLDFIARLMDEVDVRPGGAGTEVRMGKRLEA